MSVIWTWQWHSSQPFPELGWSIAWNFSWFTFGMSSIWGLVLLQVDIQGSQPRTSYSGQVWKHLPPPLPHPLLISSRVLVMQSNNNPLLLTSFLFFFSILHLTNHKYPLQFLVEIAKIFFLMWPFPLFDSICLLLQRYHKPHLHQSLCALTSPPYPPSSWSSTLCSKTQTQTTSLAGHRPEIPLWFINPQSSLSLCFLNSSNIPTSNHSFDNWMCTSFTSWSKPHPLSMTWIVSLLTRWPWQRSSPQTPLWQSVSWYR